MQKRYRNATRAENWSEETPCRTRTRTKRERWGKQGKLVTSRMTSAGRPEHWGCKLIYRTEGTTRLNPPRQLFRLALIQLLCCPTGSFSILLGVRIATTRCRESGKELSRRSGTLTTFGDAEQLATSS